MIYDLILLFLCGVVRERDYISGVCLAEDCQGKVPRGSCPDELKTLFFVAGEGGTEHPKNKNPFSLLFVMRTLLQNFLQTDTQIWSGEKKGS